MSCYNIEAHINFEGLLLKEAGTQKAVLIKLKHLEENQL